MKWIVTSRHALLSNEKIDSTKLLRQEEQTSPAKWSHLTSKTDFKEILPSTRSKSPMDTKHTTTSQNMKYFFWFHAFFYEGHLSSLMPWVTWYSWRLSYLPGSLFLGSCPRVCILVTSSFHLPISSASPGSLNRDPQRNFPFGARIAFLLMLHIIAWDIMPPYHHATHCSMKYSEK